MSHYLTDHNYESTGKWKLKPKDVKITTGSQGSPIGVTKIGSYWRHEDTGDLVVACDSGIGGRYTVYHIPAEYVQAGNKWLKNLRLQKDKAKYSHGARVLESERGDAKEFIQEIESYLQKNPNGVLDE